MKTLVFMLVITTLSAGAAAAETVGGPMLLVHGGVALPAKPDDFQDKHTVGFGGGIGFEFAATFPVVVYGQLDFTTFDLDEGGYKNAALIPLTSTVIGGETSILYASLNLKINVMHVSAARPYILGGGGYFRLMPDDVVIDGVTQVFAAENAVGVHGGGGFDVIFGTTLKVFFEALYVVGFTRDNQTAYLPLRAGVAFGIGGGT